MMAVSTTCWPRRSPHHAASESGLPVPPRHGGACRPDTDIESWAPVKAAGVDTEVLEVDRKPDARQALHQSHPDGDGCDRRRRRGACRLGQLPNMFDIGM